MKNIFELIHRIEGFLQFSNNGYVEHFIAGSLIGGLLSYIYFEKTNHKFKSILLGITIASLIGLMKEYIDPLIGGDKDKFDLIYTFLGGIAGATIFLLTSLVKEKIKNSAPS